MDLKTSLPYVIPSLLTFFIWYMQRFFTRRDDIDSTYIDSRFEFATKTEQNLWAEIISLRKDVAERTKDYYELFAIHIEMLVECGKPAEAAHALLKRKIARIEEDQKRKLRDTEQKVEEHKKVVKTQFEKGESDAE